MLRSCSVTFWVVAEYFFLQTRALFVRRMSHTYFLSPLVSLTLSGGKATQKAIVRRLEGTYA